MRFRVLFCCAFVLSVVSSARADEPLCPNGKTIGPWTKGHCCWPEQAWDETTSSCSGRPVCPQGTTRDGITCMPVAATPSGPPQPVPSAGPVAPTATVAPAPTSPPPSPSAPPVPPPAPERKPQPQAQRNIPIFQVLLVWGGLWTAVGGYGLSTASSLVAAGAGGDCNDNGSAWLGLIPYAGPFLFAANAPPRSKSLGRGTTYNCATYDDAAIPTSVTGGVLQIIGTSALVVGLVSLKSFYDEPAAPSATSAFISPGAPGAPLGATLTVTNF